jgi:hypothetical protein
MTTLSLTKRLEALEATAPEHGLRVVDRHEDLDWTPEQRATERQAFLAGLPPHRGLTVVIRRFFSMLEGQADSLHSAPETSGRH